MDLLKILEEVVHPALGEKNIVELGMVDGVVEKDGKVEVTLGFPKKPDPSGKRRQQPWCFRCGP